MSVVGFDFGNLQSVVAVARKRGIDVLQNEVGHRMTPSEVAFSGKQRFIGNEAAAQTQSNPKNSVSNIKRLMGRRADDPELPIEQNFVTFKVAPTPRGFAGVQVNYDDKQEVFAPEQVAGALFQKLKGVAEGGLDGAKVTDCVIGVPSWWTDVQRRALLDAANVAGLNVLRLLNETTAVALQYGILKVRQRRPACARAPACRRIRSPASLFFPPLSSLCRRTRSSSLSSSMSATRRRRCLSCRSPRAS